jgi:putative flippase GtrA
LCKEKFQLNKYVSNSAGFSIAVAGNYFLNRHYTFQDVYAPIGMQFVKFFIVSLVGLALSNFFLYLLQKYSGINFYISKAIVIAVVFFWNYSANTLFTFTH